MNYPRGSVPTLNAPLDALLNRKGFVGYVRKWNKVFSWITSATVWDVTSLGPISVKGVEIVT